MRETGFWSDQRSLDTLILNVYGSDKGRFELYEDDGVHHLVIGPSARDACDSLRVDIDAGSPHR